MKKQFTIILILFVILGLIPTNFLNAQDLSNKLSGRILLQVESVGQAWYIDPGTKQRAFLGRPADAFQIMRELGLGISEKDYNLFNGYAPKNLSGRILLRVEANGEAYYVNPTDLKMYYLGRPADAFKVMREKGLGITDEDLTTVPIFQKYKEQTEANTNAINSLSQVVDEQQKKISELEEKINTNTSTSTDSCTADTWSCGAWSVCSSGGQQTRSCNLTFNCQGVNTPSPSTSQSCSYSSNNICTSWTYSDWSACQSGGTKTRNVVSSSPSGCSGGNPILSESCAYISPTCSSWTYSDWGTCTSGQQTRTITSSSPSSCAGGTPVLSQNCTTQPSSCSSWTYSDWSACQSNGTKTRTVISSSPNGCSGGSPTLTESCTYTPPACTSWTYSDWNTCSSNGQQTRSIVSSLPNGCANGSPVLTQSCVYTPPCSCSDISKECCSSCAVGDTCGGGILMSQNLIAAPADCTTSNTCPIYESNGKNWNLAVDTCQNLSTNNFYDWYLPTLDEINILYEYRNSHIQYTDDNSFMVGTNYWSSTIYDNNNTYAWLRNFSNGISAVAPKTRTWYVRCVR